MSERAEYSFSRRSLLSNVNEKVIRNPDELELVTKYKKLFQQWQEDQAMFQNANSIVRQIYARNDPNYITIKRSLQDSTDLISKRIEETERKLIELENAQILLNVIHRERKKLEQLEHQLGESARQSYIERETKKQQDLMQAYLSRTEERRAKKQLSSETTQTPIVETKNIVHSKNKNVYDVLSILILVFSSIFFMIGLISFFVGMDNSFFYLRYSEHFFLNMKDISPDSFWIKIETSAFVSLVVSLIFESCSAIMSLVLAIFNSKKALNVVSFGISMGLLTLVGIIVFCAGI